MYIIVFSGSQVNATQQPLRGQEVMRKSGDWSYVSFPNSKSPPLTPKMTPKRPLSMLPQTSVSSFPPKTGRCSRSSFMIHDRLSPTWGRLVCAHSVSAARARKDEDDKERAFH